MVSNPVSLLAAELGEALAKASVPEHMIPLLTKMASAQFEGELENRDSDTAEAIVKNIIGRVLVELDSTVGGGDPFSMVVAVGRAGGEIKYGHMAMIEHLATLDPPLEGFKFEPFTNPENSKTYYLYVDASDCAQHDAEHDCMVTVYNTADDDRPDSPKDGGPDPDRFERENQNAENALSAAAIEEVQDLVASGVSPEEYHKMIREGAVGSLAPENGPAPVEPTPAESIPALAPVA